MSDVEPNVDWHRLELHQSIEAHDLAYVTVRARFLRYFDTMAPNTPVTISYGNNAGVSGYFIGYVVSITPAVEVGKNVFERELVCIAASRILRNTARNTWRNRTAPEIVQDIGKKMGFRVITKQHGLRKKQVVQGGDTYWEFLTKLAKMTGYTLRVEGTTLYFLPLSDMVAAFASVSPVLADTNSTDYRTTLSKWDATIGNTSDDDEDRSDSAVVVAMGPNDTSPQDVKEVPTSAMRRRRATSSVYEKYNGSVVAHSRADAQLLAKAMADRGAMAYDGHAEGAGDPMLAPYRPVYIQTTDTTSNGYWIVKSVVHTVNVNVYTCQTVVSTDEVTPQRAAPPAYRVRDLSQELQQGWSPFTFSGSRLKPLSHSFVAGNTFRPDGLVAQWVAV
jgi:phage protein D